MNAAANRGIVWCFVMLAATIGIADGPPELRRSLSDETQRLLQSLDLPHPVIIEAFISPSVPEPYTQTRSELIAALRGIGELDAAHFRVIIRDATPGSAAATRAEQRYGIKPGQVINATARSARLDEIFLGVAVTCGLQTATVPFIEFGAPVEYELARSLCTAAQQKRKLLGVLLTDASVLGGCDQHTMKCMPRWPIIDQLARQYEVVAVDPAQPVTRRYDVMLAVQPSSLGPEELDRFLAAVEAGQPTLICEDPFPLFNTQVPGTAAQRGSPGMSPTITTALGLPSPAKGDTRKLWDLLGVEFSSDQIVWQAYNPYRQTVKPTERSVRLAQFPDEFVFIDTQSGFAEPFNARDPISKSIERMMFPFPGYLAKAKTSQLDFVALTRTGNKTGVVPCTEIIHPQSGTLNPERRTTATNLNYVLAARIRGNTSTAGDPSPSSLPSPSGIDVVLVSDTDMLSGEFVNWGRREDDPGTGIRFGYDNLTFVVNALDALSGDHRLLAIRRQRGELGDFDRGTEQGRRSHFAGSEDSSATGIGAASDPLGQPDSTENVRGLPLFPEFDDSQKAASLELVERDRTPKSVRQLHLVQTEGGWAIRSHGDHPVSKQDGLLSLLDEMIGLTILGTASESLSEHTAYSVLDPDAANLPDGAPGTGTRVTIRDAAGRELLALVVGKPVQDQPELSHVRLAGQIPVYIVTLSVNRLSARVADWIDTDPLRLSAAEMKTIRVHDYSVNPVAAALTQRARITLECPGVATPVWRLADRQLFETRKGLIFNKTEWVARPLATTEVLDSPRLNELSSALADMAIVGVERKPASLAEDLRTGQALGRNQEDVESLADHGFYLTVTEGKHELLSHEGETHVLTRDGVRYVLRFGVSPEVPLINQLTPNDGKAQAPTNRYLLVTADFDATVIPAPKDGSPDQMNEYQKTISLGKQRSKEINERLADWYYLVSDDVCKAVKPGHDEIIHPAGELK